MGVAFQLTLTEAKEAMEVDENGDSTRILVLVDRKSKDTHESLKGWISTEAMKPDDTKIGTEGLKKIHDGMRDMFQKQGMKKQMPVDKVPEKDKKEPDEDGDPLSKVLVGLGTVVAESVEKALGGRKDQAEEQTQEEELLPAHRLGRKPEAEPARRRKPLMRRSGRRRGSGRSRSSGRKWPSPRERSRGRRPNPANRTT